MWMSPQDGVPGCHLFRLPGFSSFSVVRRFGEYGDSLDSFTKAYVSPRDREGQHIKVRTFQSSKNALKEVSRPVIEQSVAPSPAVCLLIRHHNLLYHPKKVADISALHLLEKGLGLLNRLLYMSPSLIPWFSGTDPVIRDMWGVH